MLDEKLRQMDREILVNPQYVQKVGIVCCIHLIISYYLCNYLLVLWRYELGNSLLAKSIHELSCY